MTKSPQSNNGVRVTSPQSTQQDSTNASNVFDKCPDCDGSIVTDESHGERHCSECGRVIDSDTIDRGPEWTAYSHQRNAQKSRVGSPQDYMYHDKGLSTDIGWKNEDAHGNQLSTKKRKRMNRLRTWNKRYRTKDNKERNLRQALEEIKRMASALGLPKNVRETASMIYRRALEEDMLPGRSIEGMSTAALYAAAKIEAVPRQMSKVVTVSRVGKVETQRTYRYLTRELSIKVPITHPTEYLNTFISHIGCTTKTERTAHKLINQATDKALHSGKEPAAVAAGGIYAAAQVTGEDITQSEISEVADVSEVTIRNRYPEILDLHSS